MKCYCSVRSFEAKEIYSGGLTFTMKIFWDFQSLHFHQYISHKIRGQHYISLQRKEMVCLPFPAVHNTPLVSGPGLSALCWYDCIPLAIPGRLPLPGPHTQNTESSGLDRREEDKTISHCNHGAGMDYYYQNGSSLKMFVRCNAEKRTERKWKTDIQLKKQQRDTQTSHRLPVPFFLFLTFSCELLKMSNS